MGLAWSCCPVCSAIARRRREAAAASSLPKQPAAGRLPLSRLAIPSPSSSAPAGAAGGGAGSLIYGPLSAAGSSSYSRGAATDAAPAAVPADWDFPLSPAEMQALSPNGDPRVDELEEDDDTDGLPHALMHEYENSDALAAIVAAMVLDDSSAQ